MFHFVPSHASRLAMPQDNFSIFSREALDLKTSKITRHRLQRARSQIPYVGSGANPLPLLSMEFVTLFTSPIIMSTNLSLMSYTATSIILEHTHGVWSVLLLNV